MKPTDPAETGTDRPVLRQVPVAPIATRPVSVGDKVQLAPGTADAMFDPEDPTYNWAVRVTELPTSERATRLLN
jgi:hypothetical protein